MNPEEALVRMSASLDDVEKKKKKKKHRTEDGDGSERRKHKKRHTREVEDGVGERKRKTHTHADGREFTQEEERAYREEKKRRKAERRKREAESVSLPSAQTIPVDENMANDYESDEEIELAPSVAVKLPEPQPVKIVVEKKWEPPVEVKRPVPPPQPVTPPQPVIEPAIAPPLTKPKPAPFVKPKPVVANKPVPTPAPFVEQEPLDPDVVYVEGPPPILSRAAPSRPPPPPQPAPVQAPKLVQPVQSPPKLPATYVEEEDDDDSEYEIHEEIVEVVEIDPEPPRLMKSWNHTENLYDSSELPPPPAEPKFEEPQPQKRMKSWNHTENLFDATEMPSPPPSEHASGYQNRDSAFSSGVPLEPPDAFQRPEETQPSSANGYDYDHEYDQEYDQQENDAEPPAQQPFYEQGQFEHGSNYERDQAQNVRPQDPEKKKGFLGKLFSSFRRPKKGGNNRKNNETPQQTEGGDPNDTFQRPDQSQEHWRSNPQLFHGGDTLNPAAGSVKAAPTQPVGTQPAAKNAGTPALRAVPRDSARVILLDGEELEVPVDKRATGSELMNGVCSHLELTERDYFGLTYVSREQHMWFWLDLEKKISKQIKDPREWLFSFQVKFYPPEPALLLEDLTRYQVSLQVRQDVFTGKLNCTFVTQALLGSFVAQSELGDWDEESHGPVGTIEYLRSFEFVYEQSDDLLTKIAELHRNHRGMTPDQADLRYLETAKRLEQYGVDLHPARDLEDVDIFLGVCFGGVVVYRDRLRISRFSWPKVLRISYRKNFFYLKIRSDYYDDVEAVVGFKLMNHRWAKRLWMTAVEHHTFFRLKEPENAAKKNTLLPKMGSKYRFSGRTFFQYRTLQHQPRGQTPTFERSLTKKHSASLPSLNKGGSQYGSMHSLNRMHPRDMTLGRAASVDMLAPLPAGGSMLNLSTSSQAAQQQPRLTKQQLQQGRMPPPDLPNAVHANFASPGSVTGSLVGSRPPSRASSFQGGGSTLGSEYQSMQQQYQPRYAARNVPAPTQPPPPPPQQQQENGNYAPRFVRKSANVPTVSSHDDDDML